MISIYRSITSPVGPPVQLVSESESKPSQSRSPVGPRVRYAAGTAGTTPYPVGLRVLSVSGSGWSTSPVGPQVRSGPKSSRLPSVVGPQAVVIANRYSV